MYSTAAEGMESNVVLLSVSSGGGVVLERTRPLTSQWRRETRSLFNGQSRSTMNSKAEGLPSFQVGVLIFGVLDMSSSSVNQIYDVACTIRRTSRMHQRARSMDRSWSEDDIETFIVRDVFCLSACGACECSQSEEWPQQHRLSSEVET